MFKKKLIAFRESLNKKFIVVRELNVKISRKIQTMRNVGIAFAIQVAFYSKIAATTIGPHVVICIQQQRPRE